MGLGCFFDLGGEVFSSGAFSFFRVKSTTTPRGDPPEELGRWRFLILGLDPPVDPLGGFWVNLNPK